MSENQSREAVKVKLNELYEEAKTKGSITKEEVANQLMELEIDADQINKVYEVLESLGVDVVNEFDPVPPEELIEPENIDLLYESALTAEVFASAGRDSMTRIGAARPWQLAQAPSNNAAPRSAVALGLTPEVQGGDGASDEVFLRSRMYCAMA